MRDAIENGDDSSLARALVPPMFNATRTNKKGHITHLDLTDSANKMAGGEFNRFYLRGLALRAIDEGIEEIEVYRARQVADPRPESEALIGKRLPARALLDDLRANKGFGTFLGVPMGPHSGLSARLPRGK